MTLYYGGLQLSRQNQKPHGKNKIRHGKTKKLHGKNKIPHGKTKNLTAKTKYLTAKPKTSRQNQILHSKNKIALVLPWVFAFFHSIWFCREVFGFAVRFLVLPWQLYGTVYIQWREMWEFLNTFNILRSSVSLLNLLPVKAFYKICLLKIT